MSRILSFFYKILMLCLIAFLLMLYGFLSSEKENTLTQIMRNLNQGTQAAQSLFILEVLEKRSAHEISAPFDKGGVITYNKEDAQPGLTLITAYDSASEAYRATLIDLEGNEIHEWKIPFDSNPELALSKDVNIALSKRHKFIHGYNLDKEGNLILVLESTALIKLDKNSQLLWMLNLPVHHSIAIAEDGSIWTLSRRIQKKRIASRPFVQTPHWDDQVIHVSSEGELLETFSIIESIYASKYEGILYAGSHPGTPRIKHEDPLHTNDIEILTAQQASHFSAVEAGDIMLSLRTINAVVIVGAKDKLIKWSMTGPFLRQHDPEIDSDGNIFIFDNRTATALLDHAQYSLEPKEFGYSRVIKFNPENRQILWQFQGSVEQPFYSSIQGRIQVLNNGNVLVVEPEGGRVFELHPENNSIVWEYRNLLRPGWVGRISDADRYDAEDLPFLKSLR